MVDELQRDVLFLSAKLLLSMTIKSSLILYFFTAGYIAILQAKVLSILMFLCVCPSGIPGVCTRFLLGKKLKKALESRKWLARAPSSATELLLEASATSTRSSSRKQEVAS